MSEACHHDHPTHGPATRPLILTLLLVAAYFFAELIGGLWTGSLALLADAGHMFSDMAALMISLFAAWIATRKGSSQQTFGYHRAEILAASINSASLFLIAGRILYEAWVRLSAPSEILAGPMLWIALGGLVVNLLTLKILHSGHQHNLNVRGAWLHVMGDTLGSVGVILAAFLVWQFHWNWADPFASVLVSLLVLYSSWNLLSESVGILMENAPKDIDVQEVRSYLSELPEIRGIHCLHIWLISSGIKALSAHLVVESDQVERFQLHVLQTQLRTQFGIKHTTLQVETPDDPVCQDRSVGDCLQVSPHREACSHP